MTEVNWLSCMKTDKVDMRLVASFARKQMIFL